MRRLGFSTILLIGVVAGGPVWAQNSNPPQTTQQPQAPGNAAIGTATISPSGIPPSQRNPLLTDNGEVRIGKMVGTAIYNKNDQKVGSVDDVIAGQNGQLQVIVATSGKKVAVPWDHVQFGDAKLNSDNKVLMPDATQKGLDSLPPFSYQKH